jgi:putative membrane protein
MGMRAVFSESDLEAIRRATADGERRSGGEIVPYIVDRVVDSDEARWSGATLGALGAALVAGVVHAFGDYWGGFGVWWITLPAVVGAGTGYLAAGLDAVGRRLIPEDRLERAVDSRAKAAFLEEEVFATRDRTGILIFLALFEHRAVILADSGIHSSVPEGAWQRVVDGLITGIKAGRAAKALEKAISDCGDLLEEYGVERRTDDEDELPDEPRIRER